MMGMYVTSLNACSELDLEECVDCASGISIHLEKRHTYPACHSSAPGHLT